MQILLEFIGSIQSCFERHKYGMPMVAATTFKIDKGGFSLCYLEINYN